MARGDWGATNADLSGTFTSWLNYINNQAQSATNRAVSMSNAQQSALDSDMYNRWQNGIVTDQQWLDYIHQRLTDTQTNSDPSVHQQWVETYRQMSQKIADDQAEAAYKDGTISINQLIAHYSDRMSSLQKNSDEYRTLSSHYYDLVDKRDGQYIDQTSMDMVAQIERGHASYKDLLAFYKDQLSKVRSSSPLVAQIKQQIQNIQDIVDGVSGGGGSGGGGSSASAKAAAAANKNVSAANAAVTRMYRSGNVFVPYGDNVVKSTFDLFSVKDTTSTILDAMKADSLNMETMMKNWKADPNAPFLTDPRTNEQIPNTPENRLYVNNQALRTYDFRAALLDASGKYSEAATARSARNTYMQDVIQYDNTTNVQDFWQANQQQFWERVQAAENNPDPYTAMQDIAKASKDFSNAAANILGERIVSGKLPTQTADQGGGPSTVTLPTNLFAEQQVDGKMKDSLAFAQKLASVLGDTHMSTADKESQLSMLMDNAPTSFFLSKDDLKNLFGSVAGSDTPGSGVLGVQDARDGLTLSTLLSNNPAAAVNWQITNNGNIQKYTYVGMPDGTTKAVPDSQVASTLGLDNPNYHTSGAAKPIIENINGHEQLVWYAVKPVPAVQAWQNKNGEWVTQAQVQNAVKSNDPQAIADAGFTKADIPELSNWGYVKDNSGNIWYVDPADGHMTMNPPFTTGYLGGFAPELVKGGKVDITRAPFSTAGEYVAGVGTGVSMQDAQRIVDQAVSNGEIDLNQYHSRDASNNVSFDPLTPTDVSAMYWTPADDAMLSGWQSRGRYMNAMSDSAKQASVVAQKTALARRVAQQSWLDENMSKQQQLQFNKMNEGGANTYDYAQNQIQQQAQQIGLTVAINAKQSDQSNLAAALAAQTPAAPPAVAPVTIANIKKPTQTADQAGKPGDFLKPLNDPLSQVAGPTRVGGFKPGM